MKRYIIQFLFLNITNLLVAHILIYTYCASFIVLFNIGNAMIYVIETRNILRMRKL